MPVAAWVIACRGVNAPVLESAIPTDKCEAVCAAAFWNDLIMFYGDIVCSDELALLQLGVIHLHNIYDATAFFFQQSLGGLLVVNKLPHCKACAV